LPHQEPIQAGKLGVSNQQSKSGNGITLRYRDYTIGRRRDMAVTQEVEKMFLKITNNVWLCNV